MTVAAHDPSDMPVDRLAALLSGRRFSLNSERGLQDGIEELLDSAIGADWLCLSMRKQSQEPRWYAAYAAIGDGLRSAGFGYAMDHSESRVLARVGTEGPPI